MFKRDKRDEGTRFGSHDAQQVDAMQADAPAFQEAGGVMLEEGIPWEVTAPHDMSDATPANPTAHDELDAESPLPQDSEPALEGQGMTEDAAPTETEGAIADELATWVEDAPDFRNSELEFMSGAFGSELSVDASGNLMAPVQIGDWTMLLVYDSRFPRATESGMPCAAIYFVNPLPEQIAEATGIGIEVFTRVGDGGNRYLAIDDFDRFCKAYAAGRSKSLMAEKLIHDANQLKKAYEESMARGGTALWTRPTITSSKYVDTRSTTPDTQPHPACRKVVLSDRAFVQMYNETQARLRTETGGLLLGHFENGIWYVVEACDPGWDAVFRPSYHEANENYENHVCEIISRTYRHPLAFLGMWHRHPGDLDTFSGTDDDTNLKYVDACGNGCISALINYDPRYRITFYYAQRAEQGGVCYFQVDVEVGDDKFDNQAILQVASVPGGAVGILEQSPSPQGATKGAGDHPNGVTPPLPVIPGDGRRMGEGARGQARGKSQSRPKGRGGGLASLFPPFR